MAYRRAVRSGEVSTDQQGDFQGVRHSGPPADRSKGSKVGVLDAIGSRWCRPERSGLAWPIVRMPCPASAPVAQLDRAGGFYPPGCGFDSCRGLYQGECDYASLRSTLAADSLRRPDSRNWPSGPFVHGRCARLGGLDRIGEGTRVTQIAPTICLIDQRSSLIPINPVCSSELTPD